MSFLNRIQEANQFNPKEYYPFFVGRAPIGWIKKSQWQHIAHIQKTFTFKNDEISLSDKLHDFNLRTKALHDVTEELISNKIIRVWQSETYPVVTAYNEKPYFLIERAASTFFGIKCFGTHLNGYVRKGNDISLWIAKRGESLYFAPKKLDNTVAGGLPFGLSPLENIVKEALEEANIANDIAVTAKSSSMVNCRLETDAGVIPDSVFVYDIELSPDFVPKADGNEISEFNLLPLAELYDIVFQTQDFKVNSALVIIDFLVRFGKITPDDKHYQKILLGLRNLI